MDTALPGYRIIARVHTPPATLFISDLHLDGTQPQSIARLEAFLEGSARDAAALYILGDLFETWVGDDDDDPARERACRALRAYTGAGHACYVCQGNRDFLLGAGFCRRTGCELLGDPTVIDLNGEAALLTHGDALCTGDTAYQRLRSLVRDVRWQRRMLRLPLTVRRALASAARAGSRNHTRMTADDIMDASPAAIAAALRACGTRLLIHGHTHRPGVHEFEFDGGTARRYVLGAWHEQGSCLRCEPGRIGLETF